MIGALVSYEAERLTVGKLVHQIKNQDKKNTGYFADGSRRYPVARLRFNVSNGEVRGMSPVSYTHLTLPTNSRV